MKFLCNRFLRLSALLVVVTAPTTMALLIPSAQTTRHSTTDLSARTHRGGRILNNRSNYGVSEVGADSVGMGTYGSNTGKFGSNTSNSITRMDRRRRSEGGVRELGPNSIGTGENYGANGNMRPYQSAPMMKSGGGSGRRASFFPSPSRYDSPIRSSSRNGSYGTIQGGGSRKTFSSNRDDPMVVELGSDDGRPIETEVELWQGPDNTPHRMRFYSQNGSMRPLRAMVDTSSVNGYGGTMQVRNSGPLEFPVSGSVSSYGGGGGYDTYAMRTADSVRIQGGSLRTMTVHGDVEQVRVDMETDGLPLMATIELWQGPGEAMQVAQIYNDCGRPFSTMVDTPGGFGSTIAIRNEGPMEFPIQASISY